MYVYVIYIGRCYCLKLLTFMYLTIFVSQKTTCMGIRLDGHHGCLIKGVS